MKNPNSLPLQIVGTREGKIDNHKPGYSDMLVQLAQAEATLAAAGFKSGLPHFIAIVKELEYIYGFKFEIDESKEPIND